MAGSGRARRVRALAAALVTVAGSIGVVQRAEPAAASAGVLTVDSSADTRDLLPGDGICRAIDGGCTFRAALDEANAAAGVQTIAFASPVTVRPILPLPDITDPVVIDGGGLGVIDGSQMPESFALTASATATVRGLTMRKFERSSALLLGDGAAGSVVESSRFEDNWFGISVAAPAVRIGSEVAPNVIVGSTSRAVRSVYGVFVDYEGAGATVEGNTIRDTTYGSDNAGVVVYAPDAVIRRNGISGNGVGVFVRAGESALVRENRLVGNYYAGVRVWAGDAEVVDNTIVGTAEDGISVSARGAVISGNLIGGRRELDPAAGNGRRGIHASGDGTQIIDNVVSGSGWTSFWSPASGIEIFGSGLVVRGNTVTGSAGNGIDIVSGTGVAVVGNTIEGNAGTGVVARGAAHDIGGTTAADGNRIIGNGRGVLVTVGEFTAETTNVWVQGNSITGGVAIAGSAVRGVRVGSNVIRAENALAIDLGGDGSTANDSLDVDEGPNRLQNAPEVLEVRPAGSRLRTKVRLESTPGSTFVIELFVAPSCSSAPVSTTRTLGKFPVQADSAGRATLDLVLDASLTRSETVVATATSAGGDTSELSGCRPR